MADTGIKILQWNICSFNTRKLDLLGHIQDHNYDIILLQETRIWSKDRAGIKIQGYSLYFQYPNPDNSKTHGLITAVSNDIPSKYIPSPYTDDNMETLVVKITLPSGTYHIHNVYISPKATNWKPQFHDIDNKHILIAGNYNARALLWDDKENTGGKILEEGYLDKNDKFKLLNNAYEHTTEHSSTIDITFASNALSSKCTWQVNNDIISDIHYGIEVTPGLRNYCSESDFIPRYKLYEADWDGFSIALDNTFHNFDTNNINTLPTNYIATIINDHFIKVADETIAKTKFSKTPWRCWYWNDDCTKYRRLYHQALSKFNDKRYPRTETRPIVKAAKATLKETYELAKLEIKIVREIELDRNDAKVWRKLNHLKGLPSPRMHPDPQQQAEHFADEFANRTSSCNLPDTVLNELNILAPIRENAVTNSLAQPDEIYDKDFIIQELNKVWLVNWKSAPGSDGVNRSMLHHAGPKARQILLEFINKLYKDRHLPSTWKQAEQVPIRKPDKKNVFRPIYLLSMVLNRALTIDRHQLIELLYGFLPHRGTTDGLVTLVSAITENMNSKTNKDCIAVYVDLEKAVELAHPLVVAYEASKLGIEGHMLAYIVDYLKDRKGTIKYQGTKSQVRDFDLRTPQGSCISPFWFNTVMNRLISKETDDMCPLPYPDEVQTVSYADDIAIISNHKDKNELIQQALAALDQPLA